jgi:RNA polymerase sigma factor for flagellar operon FliA
MDDMTKLIKGKDIKQIIEDFLPSIRYWAHFYHPKTSKVIDQEDLVVIGAMGLMDAFKKYNPNRPNQFKTYAEFRIRGEMIDELRRMDWLSRSDRKKQKMIDKKTNELSQDLGRLPSQEELTNVLPFKKQDQDRLMTFDSNSHESFEESHVPETLKETVANEIMKKMEWHDLTEKLPYNMKRILELKYREDYNFSEIGEALNLTEGRISQLHTEAILILKANLTEDDIILLTA